jgi:hypothetical protein
MASHWMRTGLRRYAMALLITAVVAGHPATIAQSTWKRHVNVKAGYAFEYPPSWQILDSEFEPVLIANFPPRQRVKAIIVPKGYAAIGVIPSLPGIDTIEEWISRDRISADSATSPEHLVLGTRHVVQVRSRSDNLAYTACYFESEGRRFQAFAEFWDGDPRAKAYEAVLHKVIPTVHVVNTRTR